jgi:uncharacterized Tic20 family protein
MSNNEERNWSVALYLSVFSHWIVPFLGFIAPLTIWLLKKEDSDFINAQGKEVLNFQITYFITSLILLGLTLSFMFVGSIYLGILFGLMLVALIIMETIYLIIGAVKVQRGINYQVPYILRFIK